jgi:hypothetical protein
MCFAVHKTTSELEHVILTTLYLVGVKNIDNHLGELFVQFYALMNLY